MCLLGGMCFVELAFLVELLLLLDLMLLLDFILRFDPFLLLLLVCLLLHSCSKSSVLPHLSLEYSFSTTLYPRSSLPILVLKFCLSFTKDLDLAFSEPEELVLNWYC